MTARWRNILLGALGGAAGGLTGEFIILHGLVDGWIPLVGALGGGLSGCFPLSQRRKNTTCS